REQLDGVRTRTRPRPGRPDRARHRDRRMADDRVDPAYPPGSVGGRRRKLAARREAAGLDDPVGLDRVSHYLAVGVGSGDLREDQLLAAADGAGMAHQVGTLGGADIL